MATTVQSIIDAALARSLVNDAGTTDLANNTAELTAVISRMVRSLYTLAGMPVAVGGWQVGHYFTVTQTVALGNPSTTYVALPTAPEFVYIFSVTDAGNDPVAAISLMDLRDGTAETPPAVVIVNQTIRSAGRVGDPTASAVLTLDGAYLPPALTATTDYLGATTPATASTSAWPGHVGDPFVIASLARYLVIKDTMRDPTELQALDAEIGQAAQALGQVIGVAPAAITAVRPT